MKILGITVTASRQFALPRRQDLGYFALVRLLGITLHQWLQTSGLVSSQAGTTAWIVATTLVFMATLGWLALKEKLTWLPNQRHSFGRVIGGYGRRLIANA